MNRTPHLGEVRPATPLARPESASAGPPGSTLPLVSLRGERRVIGTEACRLGPRCLVCAWRRAGLLDPPERPGDDASPRTEAA